jgi:hypothetical protein
VRELRLDVLIGDERIVDVGERVLDRELIVVERCLLRGLGLATWPLTAPNVKIGPTTLPA